MFGTRIDQRNVMMNEDAVKRIVRYMKGTHEKGLIFEPTGELTFEDYVDADFAGL